MSGSVPQQRVNTSQTPSRRGLFIILVELTAALVASIVVSLFLGTLIEWAGMNLWWKDQGVLHSRDMVVEDIGYLENYRRSLVVDDAVEFASGLANAVTKAVDYTGLLTIVQQFQKPLPPNPTASRRSIHNMMSGMGPYVLAAIFVWQDAMIRLAIVWLAIPAFLLALTVGLVDGLARRDIRKWSGGRESSYVYHHAKRLLVPAFTGGFLFYMTWPTGGFNPAWMVLPFCAAAAWTVSLMAATFKKYL